MTIHTAARAAFTPTGRRAHRILTGRFNSVVRLYAVRRAWLQRRAERHNATLAESGTYTAAQYLRHVVHASEQHIRTYAGAFGREAAKAHRALFAADPAQDGLTVIGNHPRFTAIATYGPGEHAALEQAARTHKATAALAETEPEPETPAATIDPAVLAVELSDRYFERTPGALRTASRRYVAGRVAEIVEGVGRTAANYNPATGLLTDAGAEAVTDIIANAARHDGWSAIGELMDAQTLTHELIGA
jgi:hypothetical protein